MRPVLSAGEPMLMLLQDGYESRDYDIYYHCSGSVDFRCHLQQVPLSVVPESGFGSRAMFPLIIV
jgi:hypothetical protein